MDENDELNINENDLNGNEIKSGQPNDGESISQQKEVKPPVDIDDLNRTMVLQVDRTDLRLISPDRKVILLHKHHGDVTTCIQV